MPKVLWLVLLVVRLLSTAAPAKASRTMTDPRGVSVDEARFRLGNMGKTHFYDLVKQGKIRVVKLGNRTVVPLSEIARLLNGDDSHE